MNSMINSNDISAMSNPMATMAISRVNLCSICPDGNVHADFLSEWAKVFGEAFTDLGIDVTYAFNEFDEHALNVIFGAHLLNPKLISELPKGSVLVNLEQLEAPSPQINQQYLSLLREHIVWDYSRKNIEFLRAKLGVSHASYVPVSTGSCLKFPLLNNEQDIDVLFYGSLSPRRRAILSDLDKAGLNVKVLTNVYGEEKNAYISRAKVILCLAYYEPTILETTRVIHAITNGKAVVAEANGNTELDERLDDSICLSAYDDLVKNCIQLVEDESKRVALERRGLKVSQDMGALNFLKSAIGNYADSLSQLISEDDDIGLSVEDQDISDSHLNYLLSRGELHEAERVATGLIAINPSNAQAWNAIGAVCSSRQDIEDAETAFRCVVTLAPDSATANANLARILTARGKLEEALSVFEVAVSLTPTSAPLLESYFELLVRCKNYQRVLDQRHLVEDIAGSSKSLMLSLARSCRGLALVDLACKFYLAAVGSDVGDYAVQSELCVYFFEQGRIKDAIGFYASAIEHDRLNVGAYHGIGTCYQFLGNLETAQEFYEQVLRLEPKMPGTLRNLAHIYHVLMRPLEAIESMRKVLEIYPDDFLGQVQLAYYQRHICDWTSSIDIESSKNSGRFRGASPFQMLVMTDDSKLQLELARHFQKSNSTARKDIAARSSTGRKLRVGFFGSDFHDHATLVLMSGFFREYDRESFEYFIYSYGVHKTGSLRQGVEGNVDSFRDVSGLTDPELVVIARQDELDIAIDLKGFTNTGRLEPFERGIAPVQVSFLGYPGTLGRETFDYMVADSHTIPAHLESSYDEKIMRMPYSYQPNDNQRVLNFMQDQRSDHGLPESGFVFCCFNNSYKISAQEFDVWMRILSEVDGSVLWLLEANQTVKQNLRASAAAQGINPDRLVFAARASQEAHLSRHKHADLFLDTFRVNAHTTTSDALWAGLPVLTLQGEQFAARVASSLLNAVNLDELVVTDADAYEQLAIKIANDEQYQKRLRAKLTDQKASLPLFDTKSYCQAFGLLLKKAFNLRAQGKELTNVAVSPDELTSGSG